MLYKYRWHYAVGIVMLGVLATYYYVMRPKLKKIDELRETKNQLLQQVADMQKLIRPNSVMINNKISQPMALSDLFDRAYASGVKVQVLEMRDVDVLHLKVFGNFEQLQKFLFMYSVSSNIALLLDFSFQLQSSHELQADMDMLIKPAQVMSVLQQAHVETINPFCMAFNQVIRQDDVIQLQRVSLEQMKMIGFVMQSSQKTAVIALPNGESAGVVVNSIVGLERGIVTAIFRDHIIITVSGQQKVLKMEGS